MKVIFETIEDDAYFEIILREDELERLQRCGIAKDFAWDFGDVKQLNVFIRKEDEDAAS